MKHCYTSLILFFLISSSCSMLEKGARNPSSVHSQENCQELGFPFNFECSSLKETLSERRLVVKDFREKLRTIEQQPDPVEQKYNYLFEMFTNHASGELKDFLLQKLEDLHQDNLLSREQYILAFSDELDSLEKFYDAIEREFEKNDKYIGSEDQHLATIAKREFNLVLDKIMVQDRTNGSLHKYPHWLDRELQSHLNEVFHAKTLDSFKKSLTLIYPGSISGNWNWYRDVTPLFFEKPHEGSVKAFVKLGELTPEIVERLSRVIPSKKISISFKRYSSVKSIRAKLEGSKVQLGYAIKTYPRYAKLTFKRFNILDLLEGKEIIDEKAPYYFTDCPSAETDDPRCHKAEWSIH